LNTAQAAGGGFLEPGDGLLEIGDGEIAHAELEGGAWVGAAFALSFGKEGAEAVEGVCICECRLLQRLEGFGVGEILFETAAEVGSHFHINWHAPAKK
jgi:hypothetical protein